MRARREGEGVREGARGSEREVTGNGEGMESAQSEGGERDGEGEEKGEEMSKRQGEGANQPARTDVSAAGTHALSVLNNTLSVLNNTHSPSEFSAVVTEQSTTCTLSARL